MMDSDFMLFLHYKLDWDDALGQNDRVRIDGDGSLLRHLKEGLVR